MLQSHADPSPPRRRWWNGRSSLRAVAIGTDAAMIAVALGVAYIGRDDWFPTPNHDVSVPTVAPFLGISWLLLLWAFGAYRPIMFEAGSNELSRIWQASLTSAGIVSAANYLAHHQLSRGFFVLAYGLGITLLLVGRSLLRNSRRWGRTTGRLQTRVLILGGPEQIDELAAVFRRETWLGYAVIGALTPGPGPHTPGGVPILDLSSGPIAAVESAGAEVLVVAGGTDLSAASLREIAWELDTLNVQLIVAPTITDIAAERVTIRPVAGLSLVHLAPPRGARSARSGKRWFDVVVATLLLLITSPLMAYAACAIRLSDHGPVLYRQRRIGRGGNEFDCLKFRTMATDAEQLMAELQTANGPAPIFFKLKDDPRITRPGRWLRRFSIDELPQLLNVLKGDMSLVGPRPQVHSEVALYDSGMARRLHVRPGMTGLWQVSGRSDLSYEDARRLDIYYVDNWSMAQDLSILWRTIGAVLSGSGAY